MPLPPLRPPPKAFGLSAHFPAATTKAGRLEYAKWNAQQRSADLEDIRSKRKSMLLATYELSAPKPAPGASPRRHWSASPERGRASPGRARRGLASPARVSGVAAASRARVEAGSGWFPSPVVPPFPAPPARLTEQALREQQRRYDRPPQQPPQPPPPPPAQGPEASRPSAPSSDGTKEEWVATEGGGFRRLDKAAWGSNRAEMGQEDRAHMPDVILGDPDRAVSPLWPVAGSRLLMTLDAPGGALRLERSPHATDWAAEGRALLGEVQAMQSPAGPPHEPDEPSVPASAHGRPASRKGSKRMERAMEASLPSLDSLVGAEPAAEGPARPHRHLRKAPLRAEARSPRRKLKAGATAVVGAGRFVRQAHEATYGSGRFLKKAQAKAEAALEGLTDEVTLQAQRRAASATTRAAWCGSTSSGKMGPWERQRPGI